MTEKYTVEESTKRVLERIDPIDSLMFDVGVARHQMMVGDLDTALRYLGPDGALHELRKCLMANFVDTNKFYEIQKDIERNIQAIESYKSTGDENEFYEALKVLDALHLWLMKKAYSAFKKLDPSNPGSISRSLREQMIKKNLIKRIDIWNFLQAHKEKAKDEFGGWLIGQEVVRTDKMIMAVDLWNDMVQQKEETKSSKMGGSNSGSNPGHDFGAWFVPIFLITVFVGLPLGWWALTSTFPPAEKRGLV